MIGIIEFSPFRKTFSMAHARKECKEISQGFFQVKKIITPHIKGVAAFFRRQTRFTLLGLRRPGVGKFLSMPREILFNPTSGFYSPWLATPLK